MLTSGSTNLSLRALAREVDSSHRMLTYHFGGSAGLLAAVVDEVERRQQEALAGLAIQHEWSVAELSWAFWEQLSSPELAPVERLFFQLSARLLDQGELEAAARLSMRWHDQVAGLLEERGLTSERARRVTRLGAAVYRGLLLDLLATGDRSAVDDAVRTYIESVFVRTDQAVSSEVR